MGETRTMYMHTLDGYPASFEERDGGYLYFPSSGHRSRAAKLVRTLRQIEREQQSCIRTARANYFATDRAYRPPKPPDASRYGYVLVLVPAGSAPGSQT